MRNIHPLQYFGWEGRQWEYPHQYYYRNNIGEDIPIDVPPNQNIGGDVSPASPVALTPVFTMCNPALTHVKILRPRAKPLN